MTSSIEESYTLKRRSETEKVVDAVFKNFALTMASMVALILFGILLVVFLGASESIGKYGIKFLFTSEWNPVSDNYGAFTAIYGTILTSFASLIIAIPLGLGTALFITEDIAGKKISIIIGTMVELLAAIPSVVLGLWAIFIMEPFIRPVLTYMYEEFSYIPLFSFNPVGPGITPAILILVVMILPIITSISRDSLNQVPKSLREGAYGVGATRWLAIFNVILPAAVSGIAGGVLLALGRAMGETMAVTMIIGNSNTFNFSIFAPGNTISSMLANQFGEADGSQVSSLLYAALILMTISLAVNVLARILVKKLSLKY